MVQGQELEALRAAMPYQHIVYCGDGANDLCPALALASTDTVLARKVGLTFACYAWFTMHDKTLHDMRDETYDSALTGSISTHSLAFELATV